MTTQVDLATRTAAPLPASFAGGAGRLGDWWGSLAGRPGRAPVWAWVLLLAAVAVVVRIPFLGVPLSPDEGGFLMVARQWSPGPSLYGAYWVDRPPLLIGLFQLVDLAGGGSVALHLLGTVAVVVSIALAALLGRTVAPERRWAAPLAAVAATVLLTDPLFGTTEVDGELLAVPFLLAGLLAVLRGAGARGRAAVAWWAGAGAAGVAAAAVKQNMLDVVVAAAVVLLLQARRVGVRTAAVAGVAFATGAIATLAALLGWAALHGTTPAGLWDAVVTFRGQASALIAREGPSTTQARALGVATSFLVSGAAVLWLVALVPGRRRRTPAATAPSGAVDLRVLVPVVVAWEVVAAAAGGSYWTHYLIGLVPGLVLTVLAVARHRPGRRALTAVVLGYAAAASVVAGVGYEQVAYQPSDATHVEHYLTTHERPGDTGVVAFGDPSLLDVPRLPSPYPELWSLPTRVQDPHLAELTRVLRGPERPTWVVVSGTSLATWGIDATRAQPVLDHEYHQTYVAGNWHVYHLRPSAERNHS